MKKLTLCTALATALLCGCAAYKLNVSKDEVRVHANSHWADTQLEGTTITIHQAVTNAMPDVSLVASGYSRNVSTQLVAFTTATGNVVTTLAAKALAAYATGGISEVASSLGITASEAATLMQALKGSASAATTTNSAAGSTTNCVDCAPAQ